MRHRSRSQLAHSHSLMSHTPNPPAPSPVSQLSRVHLLSRPNHPASTSAPTLPQAPSLPQRSQALQSHLPLSLSPHTLRDPILVHSPSPLAASRASLRCLLVLTRRRQSSQLLQALNQLKRRLNLLASLLGLEQSLRVLQLCLYLCQAPSRLEGPVTVTPATLSV